eukprot:GHRR01030276.1.p2 GENE.GHRR01030276.1~~GHRR01030276.1.p2  ORF type:complete len:109 (-),score=43.37 GHRR01030276.1:904-1230(-)
MMARTVTCKLAFENQAYMPGNSASTAALNLAMMPGNADDQTLLLLLLLSGPLLATLLVPLLLLVRAVSCSPAPSPLPPAAVLIASAGSLCCVKQGGSCTKVTPSAGFL